MDGMVESLYDLTDLHTHAWLAISGQINKKQLAAAKCGFGMHMGTSLSILVIQFVWGWEGIPVDPTENFK